MDIFKQASNYTRPIIIGKVYYKNKQLINDIATLLVLNKNGDILTTREVAQTIINSTEIDEIFTPITKELTNKNKRQIKKIEEKYGLEENKTIIKLGIQIIDVAESITNLEIIMHKYLNLAIIKNTNKNLIVNKFPIFNTTKIKQTEKLLTIGYPFPEYEAFKYIEKENKIINTNKQMNFPLFPVEGIVTRNILDEKNNVSQFEISNPIYNGMQGGPILNKQGEIIGILSCNKIINENNITVAKLAIGINSNQIINFLKENNIEYNEVTKWNIN